MRLGGYYIELGLDASDFLSMALLAILWFLGIFAFRMGLVFLELLPHLGTLPEDLTPSPRMRLLTWGPILTSVVPALFLGPITHFAITRAAVIKVYRELAESADVEQPSETVETDGLEGPGNGEIGGGDTSG